MKTIYHPHQPCRTIRMANYHENNSNGFTDSHCFIFHKLLSINFQIKESNSTKIKSDNKDNVTKSSKQSLN